MGAGGARRSGRGRGGERGRKFGLDPLSSRDRSGGLPRPGRSAAQMGREGEPVPPVERTHPLQRQAAGVAGQSVDEKHRQGAGSADQQGFARGGQYGLQALVRVPEADAQALVEVGVEGGVGLELRVQARHPGHGDVRALQPDPFVVREQHPLHVPDLVADLQAQLAGQLLRRGEAVQTDQVAARAAALFPYALGVTRQRQRLFQLRARDDGAAAQTPQPPLQVEFTERLAQRFPGHLEAQGQFAFGRQRLTLTQFGEQRLQLDLRRVVLGDASVLGDAGADRCARFLAVRVVHRAILALRVRPEVTRCLREGGSRVSCSARGRSPGQRVVGVLLSAAGVGGPPPGGGRRRP
ncbi:hypothetical protein DF17_26195 [Streptomyces rimosus]|nr:hypothetical protein DF17_26195 [Streptomyces rimosus]